ncbi:hypothetical protein [Metabacillus litoralis]|uniref:hypothetical protein n=1 Tax=Metabacillus litoralis TaxID=152268 RepID=UPI0020411926|nr:hypothetical protein [Metabacillus litoralis]MCM3412365.1 hypothetical protein [Metabacillus litoralis]
MTASQTEIMVRQLSSGELQRLAVELLPRLYKDWETVHQSGTVEGTLKTRKGTPDAWCERLDDSYVYIQATGDPQKGKILEDLKKSIKKLVTIDANESALCVAFLNFDPQTEEINECKKLAKKHNCFFEYYSNSEVSKLLDADHNDLRYKYLKIPSPTKRITRSEPNFDLTTSNGAEPKTGERINKVLGWNNDPVELKETLQSIIEFYEKLKLLNEPSRKFFTTLVELAEPLSGLLDHKMSVPHQEVANSLNLENWQINNQMAILEQPKYGLGYVEDGEYPVQIIVQASDWPLLSDIKKYAQIENIELREIFVKLQFTLLD